MTRRRRLVERSWREAAFHQKPVAESDHGRLVGSGTPSELTEDGHRSLEDVFLSLTAPGADR